MARVDLRVPYRDKEEAKRLGARWDSVLRLWYVPEGVDSARFERWAPADPAPNIRAPSYYLAASSSCCWRCRRPSRVHGFILPASHETRDEDARPGDPAWAPGEEPTLLCYLEWLAPPVAARLAALTPHYRVALGSRRGPRYWMNHCELCGAGLDDHEIYCEPGAGFLAFTLEDAQRISLMLVDQPFGGCCGSYSIGVTLFEEMRHCDSRCSL